MKRLFVAFVLLIGIIPVAGAQSLPEWSVWKNKRDSWLVITNVDSAGGTFIGTFINRAKGFPKCQGVGVPVTGQIQGSSISFVANFALCANTITVWKGTLSGNTITTDFDLWYVDDKDTNFYEVKDKDVFSKVY